MKETILLIDDDTVTCNLIQGYLSADNFTVFTANCAQDALQYIHSAPPLHLILLDLGLPDMDGNELIKAIRSHSDIPIIIISVRSMEIDTVTSLNTGSDDYITKPVRPFELIARVRAQLRRYNQSKHLPESAITVGPLTLHHQTQKVFMEDREVFLTKLEYSLLYNLALHKGQALSKDKLFQLVWGNSFYDDNTLTVTISRLRFKLDSPAAPHKLIHTIRNFGYLLDWK